MAPHSAQYHHIPSVSSIRSHEYILENPWKSTWNKWESVENPNRWNSAREKAENPSIRPRTALVPLSQL